MRVDTALHYIAGPGFASSPAAAGVCSLVVPVATGASSELLTVVAVSASDLNTPACAFINSWGGANSTTLP